MTIPWYANAFIILYLLWEKKIICSRSGKVSWQGFVIFIPGLCLFWMGELAGEYFMLYFSCWLIAWGCAGFIWGWTGLR